MINLHSYHISSVTLYLLCGFHMQKVIMNNIRISYTILDKYLLHLFVRIYACVIYRKLPCNLSFSHAIFGRILANLQKILQFCVSRIVNKVVSCNVRKQNCNLLWSFCNIRKYNCNCRILQFNSCNISR